MKELISESPRFDNGASYKAHWNNETCRVKQI